MDVGSELRSARHARGLSLDQVTGVTKISASVLRAIESNAFDTIPGGLFTRGYLRAYAQAVGVDPQPIVERYRAEFEPPEPPEVDQKIVPLNSTPVPFDSADEESAARHVRIVQFCVIMVVALAYLASLRQAKSPVDADLRMPDAAATSAAAEPAAAARPVGTSGTIPATTQPLTIEMRPVGPCWVRAVVDGEHAVARLMNAGDRETVRMRDDLTLRVGDPTAFAFSIDGVAGRVPGAKRHPVTVRINRANYRTLLSR